MSSHLEQLASEKASREQLADAAYLEGMRSMWEDGIEKVASGITSTEELARVCSV
jgi:type II secretory ATPase GspE/PulE/Tfp pilus assembly ATPase PilB-like protein